MRLAILSLLLIFVVAQAAQQPPPKLLHLKVVKSGSYYNGFIDEGQGFNQIESMRNEHSLVLFLNAYSEYDVYSSHIESSGLITQFHFILRR